MTFGIASLSHKEDAVDWLDHPDLQRLNDQEDLWQVIQHLTAQLDANPQDAHAYFLRGNAYLDQRCFDLARDDYTHVLELTPDDPIAYNNRGIAYRSLGNPARATEDYRQALVLDQRYRDAYNNLGLALSDLGEFEAAVQAYTEAITIDSHDWHAYNNRGLALWALGYREDARRDYEKVRELIGGLVGRVYLEEGKRSMLNQQRNVLLIVVDQWRGDTLGVLEHPCIRTPHLDALCADGVTFRRHFTQAAPCGPGRASLLTGLYMMNHRVVQNSVPMDARHTNLALEMRKGGYEPALVGYTTTTPDPRVTPPRDPRFRILGSLMRGWHPVGSWEPEKVSYFNWLRTKGFSVPETPEDIWLPLESRGPGATTSASRIPKELSDTAWATECALSYLEGMAHQRWFLHLGYYRPHPPFIAPAPYNTFYDPAEVPAPVRAASPEVEAQQHPLLAHYIRSVKQSQVFRDGQGLGSAMSEAEVRRMRTAYYGMISEVDDHLGRVIGYLKETGQYDKTLIVFTCDHGEQLGDHHLLGKIGYCDESFHIPLVLRDPSPEAASSRGRIVDQFTETLDVMPTILTWVGAEVPRTCDGRSLLPFLHGETPADWRTEVHYEFDFRTSFGSARQNVLNLQVDQCGLAVIQDTRYKYVHFDALPALFFDLGADPGQFHNRAYDPAYAPRVLEYAQKMLSWRLHYADRTLTGYSASPEGLLDRRFGKVALVAE